MYCFNCAPKLISSYTPPVNPANLFTTSYQLEKYIKHTAPTSVYDYNSIFTNPSTVSYKDYIVSTISSGHIQVDSYGKINNIVWIASKSTGITYKNGLFYSINDAIKVVFHDNEFFIHAFPIPSKGLVGKKCLGCGIPIL